MEGPGEPHWSRETGNVALDELTAAEAEQLLDKKRTKSTMSCSDVNSLLAELEFDAATDDVYNPSRNRSGPFAAYGPIEEPPDGDDNGYEPERLKYIEDTVAAMDETILCLRDDVKTKGEEVVDQLETLGIQLAVQLSEIRQEVRAVHQLLKALVEAARQTQ